MKLLLSASSLENCEKLLNEYFYSTTYKIVDNKVMCGGENIKYPYRENTNLTFKMKGKKFQILTN